MLAVSSLQDSWPMLISFSVALIMQPVDRFNDRALRPIPGAAFSWAGVSIFARSTQPGANTHFVVEALTL